MTVNDMRTQNLYLWELFWGIGLFLFLGGCTPAGSPTHPKAHRKIDKSPILATVGMATITLDEFERRYKNDNPKKLSPTRFLNELIDEKLLWLEAKKLKLQKAPVVVNEWRKAMARAAIERSFGRYFTPDSIDTLKLYKRYRRYYYDYNSPITVRVRHLLIHFPRYIIQEKELDKEQKRRWEKRKKEIRFIALQALRRIKEAHPKTPDEFEKIAKSLTEITNKPNSYLLQLWQRAKSQLKPFRNRYKKDNVRLLDAFIKELSPKIFCNFCMDLKDFLKTWKESLSKPKETFTAKDDEKFWGGFEKIVLQKEETLRFERIKQAPLYHTVGLPNLVEPFLVGTRRLKDGEFSQQLVETNFGYHIIFREKTFPAKHTPFKKAAQSIKKELFEEMRPAKFRYWIAKLAKEFHLKAYPSRLKKIQKSTAHK